MLDRIDLLIAIWDGAPAAGPGGTGAIVAEATARAIPVVVIPPDAPEAPYWSGAIPMWLSQSLSLRG